MKRSKTPAVEPIEVQDQPSMAERFQRGLRPALTTPPRHRTALALKAKERPASKGRVHKELAPLSRQDEDDSEQRGDRRNAPKNLHLITLVQEQPSPPEKLNPSIPKDDQCRERFRAIRSSS